MNQEIYSKNIDIREDYLLKKDNLLELLLQDKTTSKNILWATDSYLTIGEMFLPQSEIKTELVTGDFGTLIQPRAIKSKEEQLYRFKCQGISQICEKDIYNINIKADIIVKIILH